MSLEDRLTPSTLLWTGDVNGNWGANIAGNTNWFNSSTSTDNVLPANGDNLTFPTSGTNHTNTNDLANLNVNTITFNGSDYAVGGNTITLSNILDTSTGGTNALNLGLSETSSFTITITDATATLTASGHILGSNGFIKNGAGTLRLSGSQTNDIYLTSTVNSGTLLLAKNAGLYALQGNLTVNDGLLRLENPDQLYLNYTVTINAGASFDLNNFTTRLYGLNVVGGAVNIGTGNLFCAAVQMTGGSISAAGAGTLTFRQDVNPGLWLNSFPSSSVATISGTIDMISGATRQVNISDGPANPDVDISAAIVRGQFQRYGTGTLRFSGAVSNTDSLFPGGTSSPAGVLELAKNSGALAVPANLYVGDVTGSQAVRLLGPEQIPDSASVSIEAGAVFDLNGFVETIGSLTLVSRSTNAAHVTTGTGRLVVPGSIVLWAGGTGAVGAVIDGNLDLGGSSCLFDILQGAATADLEVSGVISHGSINKSRDLGTLRLSGNQNNTFGAATISAGDIDLAKTSGAIAIPGILTIANGGAHELFGNQVADTAVVTVNSGGTFDLNGQTDSVGPVTVMAGGTLALDGASAGLLTTGNLSLSAATLAMVVRDAANSDRVTVNGAVSVGGSLQLSGTPSVSVGSVVTLIDNDGTDSVTGSFSGLPEGAQISVSGQLFAISYAGGSGNDVVLTRIAIPTVTGTQVNDGSAQRSRVTSSQVTFNTQVSFAGAVADAFTLLRTGGGSVSFQASASVIGGVTVVTLNNFTGTETDGFGSLNDGRYTLTALASQISANGQQMASNYTFGDTQGLFRLFGDVNGDQNVNGFDLGFFRNAFGTQAGDANYLSYLDINGDGVINGFDLGQFRTRFGTMLP